jgi:hypothetical protein
MNEKTFRRLPSCGAVELVDGFLLDPVDYEQETDHGNVIHRKWEVNRQVHSGLLVVPVGTAATEFNTESEARAYIKAART